LDEILQELQVRVVAAGNLGNVVAATPPRGLGQMVGDVARAEFTIFNQIDGLQIETQVAAQLA
jgi:hypothetical protein